MVKTAVILAAGRGTRLQPLTYDIPKGFIQIENTTLIARSINLLKSNGIENIIIGTGHLAHFYEEIAETLQISTVHNELFADTGSFYTLSCMDQHLKSDFLLLESDLLYDAQAITALQNIAARDVVLCSGFTGSRDEVYVSQDDDNRLINLSKQRNQLFSMDAEMVGIWKISIETFQSTIKYYQNNPDKKTIDYERAFAKLADQISFTVLTIPDLVWCEIDDATHLQRAKNLIWPRLKIK